MHSNLIGEDAKVAFEENRVVAEDHCKTIFDELSQTHQDRLTRERDKGEYAFSARRKIVERVGLPQVRGHRLAVLNQDEREWRAQLERRDFVIPEILPLLLIRLDGGIGNG